MIATANAAATHESIELPPVGRFRFTMDYSTPIPAGAAASRELPFKGWFPTMAHNASVFLPHAFWLAPKAEGGREVDAATATNSYVRIKIRKAFLEWVARDPESHANHRLLLIPREAGDEAGRGTVKGMTVCMQIVDRQSPHKLRQP